MSRKFRFVGGEAEKAALYLNDIHLKTGGVYEEIELPDVDGDTRGFVTETGEKRYFCFKWITVRGLDVSKFWEEVK